MNFNFNTIVIFATAVVIVYQLYRAVFLPPATWTQPSRASAENKLLASWTYTGEEWARYSNTYFKMFINPQLVNSKDEVKLDLTSKYLILTTGTFSDRVVIDGKCVRTVDCAISENVLNIIRGVRYPSRVRSRYDRFQKVVFQLPIPNGCHNEAARAVEYFRFLIQEEAESIAEIYAAQGLFR